MQLLLTDKDSEILELLNKYTIIIKPADGLFEVFYKEFPALGILAEDLSDIKKSIEKLNKSIISMVRKNCMPMLQCSYNQLDPDFHKFMSVMNVWYINYEPIILSRKLDKAITVLSGQCQNGLQGSDFDEKTDKADQQYLIDFCKEIMIAFGVKVEDVIK